LKGLKEPTFFGTITELSTEVKYLGLTLDKGMTWGAQLEKITNRADRAFWNFKGTFGKETWGLKPWVVNWMYTMVVNHIITYAVMIFATCDFGSCFAIPSLDWQLAGLISETGFDFFMKRCFTCTDVFPPKIIRTGVVNPQRPSS
jgi:hypothetical protein